jgi:hypothetical protein
MLPKLTENWTKTMLKIEPLVIPMWIRIVSSFFAIASLMADAGVPNFASY